MKEYEKYGSTQWLRKSVWKFAEAQEALPNYSKVAETRRNPRLSSQSFQNNSFGHVIINFPHIVRTRPFEVRCLVACIGRDAGRSVARAHRGVAYNEIEGRVGAEAHNHGTLQGW